MLAAKKPLKTVLCISCPCCSMLLSVLTLGNPRALGKIWPSLTGHLPHHHTGTDHLHTPALILMLTNGEQGRNSGFHKQESLKEAPGNAEGRLLRLFQLQLYAAFLTLDKE